MRSAPASRGHRIVQLPLLLTLIREDLQRHGLAPTLADVAIRAIKRVLPFTVLRGLYVGVVDPAYLQANGRYRCGFLDRTALLQYCRHEYELSEEFLQKALAKGDQCFGILDGDMLASYGWYSNHPTDVAEDLQLYFDRLYMYMYKGFTHSRYRGRRLHAIGMTMALKHYLDHGFKGLVSYVESNNLSSLKSVFRMGYRGFGSIYVVKVFGRYLIHCTRGCRDYGFGVEPKW